MATTKKPAAPKPTRPTAQSITPPAELVGPGVVGTAVLRELSTVEANEWNPNVMTKEEEASLKHGFETDGWLASQALLIWGTDEKGQPRNKIIDGEHRWACGLSIGLKQGPMVVLDNLPEAKAKALTIKMNAKRGKFQDDLLGALVRDIQYNLDVPDLGLDLGIESGALMKLLAFEPESLEPVSTADAQPIHNAPEGGPPAMQQGHVSLVQLFFSKEEHAVFVEIAKRVAASTKAKNISETVLAAMREWDKAHGGGDPGKGDNVA